LNQAFKPDATPHFPADLFQEQCIAEAPLSGTASFLRRHPGINVLLFRQFTAEAHLVFQMAI